MTKRIPTFKGWRRLPPQTPVRITDRASSIPHRYTSAADMPYIYAFNVYDEGATVELINALRKKYREATLYIYRKRK